MTYQPRHRNLIALLTTVLERHPERPLFGTRKNHGWHFISYGEFGALVAAARGGLMSLGVRPGDRVAVISDNRVEWAVCSFATLTRGAIYVPMYQAQSDKDYKFILRDSGAKACFCANGETAARVRALKNDLPDLQHVIAFDSPEYAALLDKGRATSVPISVPNDDDLAFLIYTSGTTGDPKGVELTHLNLGFTASAVIDVAPLRDSGELSLAFLPWAHVFGGVVEMSVVMGYGGALAICDNTERLIDYLGEVKPTLLFAVPRIWNRVYDGVNKQISARPKPIQKVLRAGLAARARSNRGQSISVPERAAMLITEKLLIGKIQQRLGRRVRFAVSGAAALSREVAEFIDTLGVVVLEGYGLTESCAGATGSKPNERRAGSVGKPLPGVRIEIDRAVNPGGGEDEGEIVVYGPCVMRGYHNHPEQTKQALTADHGLRTGDLGRFDADGYLFITGRVKELFKLSNGKYVAPVALEEQLQLSPYIAQACVYGSDHPYNTAVIIADMPSVKEFADKRGIASTSPAELLNLPAVRELFRREIDRHSRDFKGFEQIRDFVLDSEPFTTQNDLITHSLKLKRRNVLGKYKTQLEKLYA
jgi:long-chain acyl-CoA synthetase